MASPANAADERITLRVAGREHRDWTSYRIESHLITPADAWRVTLGIPADRIPATVRPWAAMEACLGQDVVLTGRIDRIEREVAKGQHALTLSGRDGASVLVDCSAPVFTRRKVTLTEVVDLAVRPLGVSKVRVDVTNAREKVEIEPGMTAWDALGQACEANGCWAWFEPGGVLVVGGPDYAAAPVATLVMRFDGTGNNVLSLAVTEDVSGRYSEVTVLGQSHGTETTDGKHDIQHRETDPDVPGYRPLILVAGDCDGAAEAKRRAQKALMDSRLEGLTLTALVRGHRIALGGKPWTPGQRVRLVSEPHGLDATYFLMGRTFLGGRDKGGVTELTLKEDGVWLPALAKTGGTSKGKTASVGKVVDLS
ncbi:phage tail protein [Desulfovibrio sp. JY]|nr:phage tail protein [Desulfovibrio sp. JY]